MYNHITISQNTVFIWVIILKLFYSSGSSVQGLYVDLEFKVSHFYLTFNGFNIQKGFDV